VPESGCLEELAIVLKNFSFARVALECRGVDDVIQLRPAPWAFSARFTEADHWADERRENASDDDGYTENCSEASAAEHDPDDEAHGSDDEAEQETAEGVFDGCFFRFR